MSRYVVDIKPSARRRNGVVGTVVNERGSRHRFESRADAEMWAAGLSARGERHVWVRAANPDDETGADGYLVSRRPLDADGAGGGEGKQAEIGGGD